MAGDRQDFVRVKLSAAGERYAGSASLGIANSRSHFKFKAGEVVEVTRGYEWNAFLSKETTPEGELLFELVDDSAVDPNVTRAHDDSQKFIKQHPNVPVVDVPKN